jgi:type I restriction enzyme, R subunit
LKINEAKRLDLYKYVASMIRAFANIAGEMPEAGFTSEEVRKIREDVKHYTHTRDTIKLAADDFIDLKAYEPAMRQMIDTYIGAEESEVISNFNDLTLVELIIERGKDAVDALPESIKSSPEAVAETIENNLRKLLVRKEKLDPAFFARMSKILDELIIARKSQQIEYQKYLEKIVEATKQANEGNVGKVPESIRDSAAKIALYNNLNENENLANLVHYKIMTTKQDDFRNHPVKILEVKRAIHQTLQNEGIENSIEETERIYKIVDAQTEY